MIKNNSKGFTLIELLAIILIIGIITAVSFFSIGKITREAKNQSYVVEASLIVDAISKNNQLKGVTFLDVTDNKSIPNINLKRDYNGTASIAENGEVEMLLYDDEYCIIKVPNIEKSFVIEYDSLYTISSIEDLVELSIRVDGGDEMSNVLVVLEEDLDFNAISSYADSTTLAYGDINGNGTTESLIIELTTGKGFNPIGAEENFDSPNNIDYVYIPFRGIFDGNNHTISNLYINNSTEPEYTAAGLFAVINGDENDGMFLRNLNITGKITTNNASAGLVAGNATDIYSWNVNATGTITNPYSMGSGLFVGSYSGLSIRPSASNIVASGTLVGDWAVGIAMGNLTQTDIYDSSSSGTINFLNGSPVINYDDTAYIGGLIGGIYDAKVYNCFSNSNIYGTWRIGGLIGGASKIEVYNSGTKGTVTGVLFSPTADVVNLGGLIGKLDEAPGYIYNSFSNSIINAAGNYGHLGSFIGMIGTTDDDHSTILVKNCYATGSVTTTTNESSAFIGQNGASSENSRTKYTMISNIYSTGDLTASATNAVGGLVGSNIMNIENALYSGNITTTRTSTGILFGKFENVQATALNVWYNANKNYTNATNLKGGVAVQAVDLTETWFRNTLKFDNNWNYTEGYYPLLNKIDPITMKPTSTLIENQILNKIQ